MLHVHRETWGNENTNMTGNLFILKLDMFAIHFCSFFFMHNAVNCQLVDLFTRFIEQISVLFMVYVGEGDNFATFCRVDRKH